MSRAWVVFVKELGDNLRDRRSLVTALLYALMGPLTLLPLLSLVGRVGDTKVLHVAVAGADNAPGLVEHLRERDIDVKPAPPDPERAVRDLEEDVIVVIPASFGADFRAGKPATVRVISDRSRQTALGEVSRVMRAIDEYGRTVGALRLLARGLAPEIVSAIALEVDDTSTPESKGAALLAIVPMMLLMSLLLGGANVAVDATAGERERGSLEPLLSTPISSLELVAGKLGAIMTYSMITLVVAAVGFVVALSLGPDIPDMKLGLTPGGALRLVLTFVPVLLPVASMQFLLASRSRTVKEAQAATTLLSGLPAIPGMFLAFVPFKAQLVWMTVPLFAQSVLVNEVLRGSPRPAIDQAVAALAASAVGLLLGGAAVFRYARARMLRGG